MGEDPRSKIQIANAMLKGVVRASGDMRSMEKKIVQRDNFEAQSVRMGGFDELTKKVVFEF